MIGLSEEVRRYKSSAQGFFHAEPARECETFFACAQPRLGGGREGAPTTRARPQREIAWGSGPRLRVAPGGLESRGACVRAHERPPLRVPASRRRRTPARLGLRASRAAAASAVAPCASGGCHQRRRCRARQRGERAGGRARDREPASGGAASGARGGRRCRPIAASAHPPPYLPPLSAACCPAAVPPPPRARGPPCSFLVSPLPRLGCRPRRSSSRWRCRRRC
jgi:hypothetical protein